jgi:hypothetical protein
MQSSQKLRLSGGESVWFPKLRRRVTYNREISMPGPSFGGDPRRGEIACRGRNKARQAREILGWLEDEPHAPQA